jgi:long-chain acyl-CoA synthetase
MSFWALSDADPRAAALIGGDDGAAPAGPVSYGELAARADAFAEGLGKSGRKRLGAILCRNSLATVVAYLGALRAGDAVMLLNEQTAPDLLQSIVDAYRPDWIVRPGVEAVPDGYRVIDAGLGAAWQGLVLQGASAQTAPHPALAVLLSTSGTTGSPKFVRLSHKNLDANARAIVDYLGMNAGDRAITTLPFNYSYGMSVVNSHLQAGASIVLSDTSMLTREFWDAFAQHGVTSLAGVPYTYQMLHRLDPKKLGLASLRTLTQAGGRLPDRLVAYFSELSAEQGWRFFVMYGQTEAGPRISYVPPAMLPAKLGSIGVAVPGGKLSIGGDGELVYQGDNVMMGYALGRADLGKGDELGGTLHTGDLARVDGDGYFYLEGRMRRFVKVHGNRVSLDDIEHRLEERLQQPVAVVGEDDKLQVFLSAGADADVARALIQQSYRLHHTTFKLHQVDSIPMQTTGKKNYAGLPQ